MEKGFRGQAPGVRGTERRPDAFQCSRCGATVSNAAPGTGNRNHCPRCLWSLHVDVAPGDRASACGGLMEPAGVWVKRKGEWALVHHCLRCGAMRANRVAGDDSELALLSLAVRPLAQPPFPLEAFVEGWRTESSRPIGRLGQLRADGQER